MAMVSQNHDKFRAAVQQRGPYIVFRRGVVLAPPGKAAKAWEPGRTLKLDDDWLVNYNFVLTLVGILSDSKEGANDSAAVLATPEEVKVKAKEQREALKQHYAALDRERARVQGSKPAVSESAPAETKALRDAVAALEARLKALEGVKPGGKK